MTRLLIAGGGTGGHLFPGIAVAEELLTRVPSAELLFVGTARGIEARVVPELGWDIELIEVSGLKTVGALGVVRGALRIPGSLRQSRRILEQFRPDAVVGVGGYASGPVVLAAKLMGIKTAILEQNSIPGLTNRILGRFAHRIFLSFAHSESFFSSKKSALVGNPIRRQILDSLQEDGKDADEPFRLFIFGGSQGAKAVNEMCAQAASLLSAQGLRPSIVHQTGKATQEATEAMYAKAGIEADCRAFISDMAEEYRAADLIVARAGATTIAELGIVGRPAILVPYPYAANNHQELNAEEMVEAGAALMLKQQGPEDGKRLAAMLKHLMTDTAKRRTMANAMRTLGRPDAAKQIVDFISS
ncbi:MAG: undecaprenyldiphospho-muramoylpentapeptide beta-N-acetylglucosaminyltransferase [Myxococcales bacterium]|nr:undecaprenyldiphospho-muramoylpentapeptide beta-N-acetylglucosaminyltransferase [Myxococcales bacterium]